MADTKDITELKDYVEEEADVGSEGEDEQYAQAQNAGFRDFLLHEEILDAITDSGFEHPSGVQHEAIPQAILGSDILCQAKSGMGKSAVFVISTLQQINKPELANVTSAVVVASTRELVYQIKNEFVRFAKFMRKMKISALYGGVPLKKNIEEIEAGTPNVIVGTPGRLLELVNEDHIRLNKVKHFIIDECDKCLEKMDMRKDIQEIFMKCPVKKQTMLFTATLSQEMKAVCKRFLRDPVEISVESESKLTLTGLQQYYVPLEESEKSTRLCDLLDALDFNQVVIFVNDTQRCKKLNALLKANNFPSKAMHRFVPQAERIEIYKAYKNFEIRILVATDLMGRGIDVEKVNIVINYDTPITADAYLHRVGRAGRFGTKGTAVTFITTEEDSAVLKEVENRFRGHIERIPDDDDGCTKDEGETAE